MFEMSRLSGCLRVGRILMENTGSLASASRRLHSSVLTRRVQRYSGVAEEKPATSGQSPAASADASTADQINSQIEELNKTLAETTKQRDDLNDKYKRSLADSDNMRKRLTKQIDDAKIFGIHSFCKDLLEVADVLNKATECVPKEEINDSNPHLKNLYEGLTMTEAQLLKVFERHGLTPVNPLNEKFDPNKHEALFQQEVEGKAAGTVVVVSKIGYQLHDRIIRPALVGVAKG